MEALLFLSLFVMAVSHVLSPRLKEKIGTTLPRGKWEKRFKANQVIFWMAFAANFLIAFNIVT